ncbi:Sua5/YciO/YrdC/YwlC family protein [mine drainage metagenome]|uniref:L-threonylcarbamoyladenylate synthase n=1 Tax=mine drainage metagenome TaxID=410659 RepID=T1C8E9_9ZZZZ
MAVALDAAEAALRRGAIVGYPTDTLYGLAASARHRRAVDRLVAVKGRASTQPISMAVASVEEIEPWVRWSSAARAFARGHLPGPYTLLVRPSERARRELAPSIVRAAPTLGLRIPDHPIARELARRIGPITATSANRHGDPPARSATEARAALGDRVAVYLNGAPIPSGRPSILVDLTGPEPRGRPRGG